MTSYKDSFLRIVLIERDHPLKTLGKVDVVVGGDFDRLLWSGTFFAGMEVGKALGQATNA